MTDSTTDTPDGEKPKLTVVNSLCRRREQAEQQRELDAAMAYEELAKIALDAMFLGKRTIIAVEVSPGRMTVMGNCSLPDTMLGLEMAKMVAHDNYVAAVTESDTKE